VASRQIYIVLMQTTPPNGHPAPILAHEPILVVKMPGVAETFKTGMNEMTHGTDFKHVNLFHPDNGNLTHEDLNVTIHEPESRWISTLCRMIPQHPERNHYAMANSHTVPGELGCLMSLIDTR
jgi:hypothetical protein